MVSQQLSHSATPLLCTVVAAAGLLPVLGLTGVPLFGSGAVLVGASVRDCMPAVKRKSGKLNFEQSLHSE